MAVLALVLLVVARSDAEGDEAAAEPAANEAEHEAEDPGEGALLLVNVGHAGVLAELALHGHGVVGPVVSGEGTLLKLVRLHHDDLLTGLNRGVAWRSLAWHGLGHGGLAWHRLSIGLLRSVLRGTRLLGSVARSRLLRHLLLLHEGLGLSSDLSFDGILNLSLFLVGHLI